MQINPEKSLRRGRLVRHFDLQAAFDYFFYACLLAGLVLLTGVLAAGLDNARVHRPAVVALLLLLCGGAAVWVAHGLWRLHQLTRFETDYRKNALKASLGRLFPGWRLELLSSAVWRLHKPGGGVGSSCTCCWRRARRT